MAPESTNQTLSSDSSPPDAIIWVPYLSIVCLIAVLTGLIVSFYTHMIRVKRRRDSARDYVEKSIDLNRKRLYGMMRKTLDAPTKYDSLLPESSSRPRGACCSAYNNCSFDHAPPCSSGYACQPAHNSLDNSDYFHCRVGREFGAAKGHNCGYTIPRQAHCCGMGYKSCSDNLPCHCHGLVANCCCCHKDPAAGSKHPHTEECARTRRYDFGRWGGVECTLDQGDNLPVGACPNWSLNKLNQDNNLSITRIPPCILHSHPGSRNISPNGRHSQDCSTNDHNPNASFRVHTHPDRPKNVRSHPEDPHKTTDDGHVTEQRVSFRDQYRRTKSDTRSSKRVAKCTEENSCSNDDNSDIVPSSEIHKDLVNRNHRSAGDTNHDTNYIDTASSRAGVDASPRLTPNGGGLSYQTQAEINYISEHHSNNRGNKQGGKLHDNDFTNTQKKLRSSFNLTGEINPTFFHEPSDPISSFESSSNQSPTHKHIFHTRSYNIDRRHTTAIGHFKNNDDIAVPKKRTKKKLNLFKQKREKSCENAFPPPIPLDVTLLEQRPLRDDSGYASVLSQDMLHEMPSPYGAQTNEIMLPRKDKTFDVKSEVSDVVV